MYICWSIACVCVYIYILCSDCFCFRHILLLMTYLLALLLTHVFRQFLWHIHRPCTANGSPHLPYGRGRWHGAMRGDDQDGWKKIWRPSHIVTIDMSEKVSFLAMARWNHPMKFPSERRPRIETSAHAGCLSPHCIFHPRDCLWSEWSPWSAPQVGSATSKPTVPERQMTHFAHTSSDHPQLSEG